MAMMNMNFRAGDELRQAIEREAKARGVKLSTLIRDVLASSFGVATTSKDANEFKESGTDYRFAIVFGFEGDTEENRRKVYEMLYSDIHESCYAITKQVEGVKLTPHTTEMEYDENPCWMDRVRLIHDRVDLARQVMDGKLDHLLKED